MTDDSEERKAFEAWSHAYHKFPPCDYSRDDNEYAAILTQFSFLAWQAACAWQREQDAQK